MLEQGDYDSHKKIEQAELVDLAISLGIGSIGMRDNYTSYHCDRVFWLSTKLLNKYMWALYKMQYGKYNDANIKKFCRKYNPYVYPINDAGWQKDGYDKKYTGKITYRHFESPALYFACNVHDIGKIGWSDDLLFGGWTDEREFLEAHAENGLKLLHNTLNYVGVNISNKYNHWMYLVLYHHWSYNNEKRYPEELHCAELRRCIIPNKCTFLKTKRTSNSSMDTNMMRVMIGIVKLTDVLDALTSYRPYRKDDEPEHLFANQQWWLRKWKKVVKDFRLETTTSKKMFHPDVLNVFLDMEKSLKESFYDYRTDLANDTSCLKKCFSELQCFKT